MKTKIRVLSIALSIFMLAPFGSAQADSISGLYNTGVDDSHALLADGEVDTHYVIVPSWTAIPGNNPPPGFEGAWILNSASTASRWIAPDSVPPSSTSDTFYDLTLSFTIGPEFDPATASFIGRWATDNAGDVFLNDGSSLGASSGFADWSDFSADSGFVTGLNTLDFRVTNSAFGSSNPTGLRVEFLSSSVNAIPEPETYALLLAGLGLLGFVARRRREGRHVSTSDMA